MPSLFEPCGLTQLYGLAYGTLPLVRRVGGLADTVADTRLETIDTDATGFVFDEFSLPALQQALARACALHRRPADWKRVCSRAMAQSFGWDRAARAYLGLYRARPARLTPSPNRRLRARSARKRARPNVFQEQEHHFAPMDLDQFTHQYDHLSTDIEALKRAISNKLMYQVGKNLESALPEDWLHAVAYAVRDHLVERWMRTTRASYAQDVKRVYYLSMEFLIGRSLGNAMLALELVVPVRQALRELDIDPDSLPELEPDAALGNGGLGRLAACFLTRWPRSACPASATASATTTACSASRSSTASRSRCPTTGSPTATRGNSRAPRSRCACASAAISRRTVTA